MLLHVYISKTVEDSAEALEISKEIREALAEKPDLEIQYQVIDTLNAEPASEG